MALQLTSPVMDNRGDFPPEYTCNGRNVSPPLEIAGVPAGSKSLALIFDDPDAAKEPAGSGRTFDHWIIYNIPPADQTVAEDSAPAGAEFGLNSAGHDRYVGPCPPTFKHAYNFRLLALDAELDLSQPTKDEVLKATAGRVVEEARLTAYYAQPGRG